MAKIEKQDSALEEMAKASPLPQAFPALESLFKAFSRTTEQEVRKLIGGESVQLNYQKTTVDNMAGFSFENAEDVFCVFNVGQTSDTVLFLMSKDILKNLVSLMLGGAKGKPTQPQKVEKTSTDSSAPKPLTPIENYLANKVFRVFAQGLSQPEGPLKQAGLEFRYVSFDGLASFSSLPTPAAAGNFTLDVDGAQTPFLVIFPLSSVQMFQIAAHSPDTQKTKDPLWKGHVLGQVQGSHAPLSVVLGQTERSLREVMGWKVGKTIPLNLAPHSLVPAECCHEELFWGYVGQKEGEVLFSVQQTFSERT